MSDFNLLKHIGSGTRKFFINTLFDATFTQLGIISGSAFIQDPNISILITTLISASIALGISSSVSVYEAEMIEGERRIKELEDVMLSELNDTIHTKNLRINAVLSALIVFATPLISCIIVNIPFILSIIDLLSIRTAGFISIAFTLIVLFFMGVFIVRKVHTNPLIHGMRMAFFGAITFFIVNWIQIYLHRFII